MILKDNTVNPAGMSTQLLFAIMVCNQVFEDHDEVLIISSLNDAKHMKKSLHWRGDAVDISMAHVKDAKKITNQIRAQLNHHWDVILEIDHLHIEYQPVDRAIF